MIGISSPGVGNHGRKIHLFFAQLFFVRVCQPRTKPFYFIFYFVQSWKLWTKNSCIFLDCFYLFGLSIPGKEFNFFNYFSLFRVDNPGQGDLIFFIFFLLPGVPTSDKENFKKKFISLLSSSLHIFLFLSSSLIL